MMKLNGILPALVTPFDSDGRFNRTAFGRLLERVYAAGVHGVYVNGSTGEGLLQTVEQRKSVTEAAVELSPSGKQIIVHTGAATTAAALELTRHAALAGATAVSSLPPVGVYSFEEVLEYYRSLAEITEVPLLVYYFPKAGSAISTLDQILELCRLPNVVGLKFTDYNLFTMSKVKASGALVFNGYDEILVAGLLMGADGGIGTIYNLAPELFVRLYDAARAEEWATARTLQTQINELISIIVSFPVFPATKQILAWSGIDCGRCLAPRRSLTDAETAELRERVARSSFADSLLNESPGRGEKVYSGDGTANKSA